MSDLQDQDITLSAERPRGQAIPNPEVKAGLEQQSKTLQSSLLALLDRVDKVREEHDKLEGENKFLQDYIGHLMQTSKITGVGGIKSSSSGGGGSTGGMKSK